ncbi:UvrD-helicase domain-containing protein [Sorangium sp. So ce693]|uniref:UvrD-helicase domain-containing protein n=1 Tax=Sorangium sp. So ce693 TaxID=3133318 RepID=UPI003F5EDEB4
MPTSKAAWKPIGVKALEDDADLVVRAGESRLVIAGPGAGKTELLAQRAAYLLQTGLCADPQRILALSFKRDAARNLAERVRKRIGPTLAARLDSFTFDAFAKSMVDRFRNALPEAWRPTSDYELDFKVATNTRDAILAIPDAHLSLTRGQREALPHPRGTFFRKYVVGAPLPLVASEADTDAHVAGRALWSHLLHGTRRSVLAFPMITRLAQLILNHNTTLLAALRGTYAFVFLDEFQDTTGPQYAWTRTAFAGSASILTAVGDPKQCVMRWAGAVPAVFATFTKYFGGIETPLKQNHRSASTLVAVQAVVARRIDANSVAAQPVGEYASAKAECLLLEYGDHEAEAADLAARIDGWIREENLDPRDLCVLTRQQPYVYAATLVAALAKVGRRARVEQDLQDVLSEPLTSACLDLLRLAVQTRAPASWVRATEVLERLDSSLQGADRTADRLSTHTEELREAFARDASVTEIVQRMIDFLGEARFRAVEPTYREGQLFFDTRNKFEAALDAAKRGRTWRDAVDEVEGVGAIPILTAHKSKGLEYHTIVFIGLEDNAHFGFANSPKEETSVFFVALSRAKRRVVATFAERRITRQGRGPERQARDAIQSFYEALEEAGVRPVRVGPKR